MTFRYTTGAATNSKNPDRYAEGAPQTLLTADGAWVDDGKSARLVDLTSGLGAVILGHGYESVHQRVEHQLYDGVAFPLPTAWEESVAQQLVEFLGCPEWQVRWSKNGRDAVVAAVRLARAVTGKYRVAYCDYHGSDDMFLQFPPWNAGVGPTNAMKFTRKELLEQSLHGLACIVMEPVSSNAPEEPHSVTFFQELREKCTQAGVMFILDEMVSFGRAPFGSGMQWLAIEPDLWVGGKCLANGLPLTAVAGPSEMMGRFAKDVFHSMTHAGEAVSLAAASETLKVLQGEKVAAAVNAFGEEVVDLFVLADREKDVRFAFPSRLLFNFSRDELGVLLQNGVLCAGYANFTLAHARDPEARETIMTAFREVCK